MIWKFIEKIRWPYDPILDLIGGYAESYRQHDFCRSMFNLGSIKTMSLACALIAEGNSTR